MKYDIKIHSITITYTPEMRERGSPGLIKSFRKKIRNPRRSQKVRAARATHAAGPRCAPASMKNRHLMPQVDILFVNIVYPRISKPPTS